MQEINISRYYQVESDIHKLTGFTKLVSLMLFIAGVFFANNLNILVIYGIVELMIILLSNVPIISYIKSIKMLRFLIMFIIIINIISKVDFIVPITKIILIILYSNIYIYHVTK